MKFYTNVEQYGNSIFVRMIDNNKRKQFKVDFKPTIFTRAKSDQQTEWKTLDNKPVFPLKIDSIKETKEYLNNYPMLSYGPTNFTNQYIAETFPGNIKFDSHQILIYTIDIETTVEDRGTSSQFPDYKNPVQDILLISIQNNLTKEVITFGSKPYSGSANNYIECSSEKDLLNQFITFWILNPPDIISGWNINGFDISYLIARMEVVLPKNTYKKLSPWGIVTSKEVVTAGQSQLIYKIYGISTLDYLELYKKYIFTPRESYKLDYIAEVELSLNKLDHSKWSTFYQFYTEDWNLFVDYNRVDVELVDKLEDKLNLINVHYTLAYTAKLNFNDALSPVKLWDNIIYNHLRYQQIVIPNMNRSNKAEQFMGAFVKDPVIGRHKWIISFDLQSLYPHLIMQSNISPEKLVDRMIPISIDDLLNERELITDGYSVAANGSCYTKESLGFLPSLMESMYNDRSKAKKEMIKKEQQYEVETNIDNKKLLSKEITQYNNLQMALKIALNSAYGAIGNNYFRYFDIRMAEAITMTGQLAIQWVTSDINKYLNKVLKTNIDYSIMSDTDSVVGDTVIRLENEKITIADFYDSIPDNFIKNEKNNYIKSVNTKNAYCVDNNGKLLIKPIKYVMKHKVKKELFKITVDDKEIICTADHSLQVIRDNKLISIKPSEVQSNDKFIRIIDEKK